MSDSSDTFVDAENEQIPEYITNEEVEQVIATINQCVVRLEKDPTVMGPSYIHDKLKECRDHSNTVEDLLVRYYDRDRVVRNHLAEVKATYDARRAEMLAIDPEVVVKRRSADARAAYVDYKLKSLLEAINDLKEQLTNVTFLVRAVEMKKEGLGRTNNDIKKQVSLMEFARGKSGPFAADYDESSLFATTTSTAPVEEEEDLDAFFGLKQGGVIEVVAEEVGPPLLEQRVERDLELAAEEPPEVIPAGAQRHMSTDTSNPVRDILVSKEESVDSFLDNLDPGTTDDVVSAGDEEEEDLDSLFQSVTPAAKAPATPPVDEDVVDIAAFLSQS